MKPRILDLFCCAGGAGVGYAAAGFEVVGVDIIAHKNNPHPVIQMDALELRVNWIKSNFHAVHASPPCQGYTALRHAPGTRGAPKLIPQVREMLKATGLPFVIENVIGAREVLINPVMLCGTMFGLGSQGCDLHRHRLFETNFYVPQPLCRHDPEKPTIGVYGGHARNRGGNRGGRKTKDVWEGGHRAAAMEALGINWMTLQEMSEAIPPAYTEYIGKHLFNEVNK